MIHILGHSGDVRSFRGSVTFRSLSYVGNLGKFNLHSSSIPVFPPLGFNSLARPDRMYVSMMFACCPDPFQATTSFPLQVIHLLICSLDLF